MTDVSEGLLTEGKKYGMWSSLSGSSSWGFPICLLSAAIARFTEILFTIFLYFFFFLCRFMTLLSLNDHTYSVGIVMFIRAIQICS